HQGDHTVVAARRAGNYRQDPRVPQATGYRDGYVTGGPLCRPGRGGPAQPQEVPMARIGIPLMMLKDHIAEQGVTEVLSRVTETGFRVDRKSTRLNSSHVSISYAVFCLKKKRTHTRPRT